MIKLVTWLHPYVGWSLERAERGEEAGGGLRK